MNKKSIIRIILFLIFACILPILFLVWRFDLFSGKENSITMTGWGLFAVIILTVFAFYIAKTMKKAFVDAKWSMLGQIINGSLRVLLPLVAFYFAICSIVCNIELFRQALLVLIISEAIAIPINPFPKWLKDKEQNNNNNGGKE